jgi:hypothetical protein
MISNEHSAAPLPWLAAAVVFLFIVLLGLNVLRPPAPVAVEIFSQPPTTAQPTSPIP